MAATKYLDDVGLSTYHTLNKQYIQDKIDTIEIGGTNLIRNSASIQGSGVDSNGNSMWQYSPDSWCIPSDQESVTLRSDSDYIYQYNIECSSADVTPQFQYLHGSNDYRTVYQGETYTVSFDYYADSTKTSFSGSMGAYLAIEEHGSDGSLTSSAVYHDILPTDIVFDKWTRESFTFNILSESTTWILLAWCLYKDGGNVAYSKLKLEHGSKATDWCENPDDIQSKLVNYTTVEEMNDIVDPIQSTLSTKADYEEGTFTVTIGKYSEPECATLINSCESDVYSSYWRIGNICHARTSFLFTDYDSGSTGYLRIDGGLPFIDNGVIHGDINVALYDADLDAQVSDGNVYIIRNLSTVDGSQIEPSITVDSEAYITIKLTYPIWE